MRKKMGLLWCISPYTDKGLLEVYFTLYCKGYRIIWECLVAVSHLSWLLARDKYTGTYHGIPKQRQIGLRKELELGTRPPQELLHISSLLLSVHLHFSCCRLAFF